MLVHGIAEGLTFLDSNKRLALIVMLTFLELNGYGIEASDPELADWIIQLSSRLTPATRRSHPHAAPCHLTGGSVRPAV